MIAIGCDHAAWEFKELIKRHLDDKGVQYKDYGCYSDKRIDYPIYGEKAARAVANGECEKGLLFCGSGIGISISANKVKGIRCVVCSEPYSAVISRQHNNTNVLALGARVVGIELAKMIIDLWFEASFEGGRHQKRINMITEMENY
jgi:ribose 5-phosphate isomerase B